MSRAILVVTLMMLAACSKEDRREAIPSTRPAVRPNSIASANQPAAPVLGNVHTVDMNGNPLPNMMPIATLQSNAFDNPVSKGTLTNERGEASITLPGNSTLFVRAWDPTLRYFSNNYFELRTVPGTKTEPMTITMIEGASLRFTLVLIDQTPVADASIDLLMSHPKEGPWWPDKAHSKDDGRVEFSSVPAGSFLLSIKAPAGEISIGEVQLAPGASVNLGTLTLN